MIGSRIQQARLAAGLALCDLADQCDLSVVTISKYERDEMTPSSDVLLTLARLLGVRVEYFFRQHEVELVDVSCRKHLDLSEQEKKRSLAAARDQLERWLALEEFIPTRWSVEFQIPVEVPTKVSSLAAVESAAAAVRAGWKLGDAAIPGLTDTLELHGIQVFTITLDDAQKLAGLSVDANGKPAIIIVGGKHAPGDPRRFTLAHELGRSRSWIEPRELQLIKQEWGLSMASLMRRAGDLGVITPNTAAKMWKRFEDNGWDKQEPDPQYELEQSRGFEHLVYRALAEDKVSESKAAELLGLPLAEFVAQRNMEASG